MMSMTQMTLATSSFEQKKQREGSESSELFSPLHVLRRLQAEAVRSRCENQIQSQRKEKSQTPRVVTGGGTCKQ